MVLMMTYAGLGDVLTGAADIRLPHNSSHASFHIWGILVQSVIHPFWGSIFEFSSSNYLYGVSSTGSDPHP